MVKKDSMLDRVVAFSILFASLIANSIGVFLRLLYYESTIRVQLNFCCTLGSLIIISLLAIYFLRKKEFYRFSKTTVLFTGLVSFSLIWLTNKSCTFLFYLNIIALAFGIVSYKDKKILIYGFSTIVAYIAIYYFKVTSDTIFRCNVDFFIENYIQISGGMLATYIFTLIVVYFAMSSFEKTNNELEDLSQKDFLTKAYNRLKLEKDLEIIPFTFGIMLDIDYFKRINDAYGHAKGDQVLRNLCNLIRVFESEDFILYRYGGEEFFIGSVLSSREFFRRLEKLYSVLETTLKVTEEKRVTVSAGIAEVSESLKGKAFIKAADAQLYLAKESGRHQVYFKDEKLLGEPLS